MLKLKKSSTYNITRTKKGYTIIELLFAVANFAFILMIAVSAFVATIKLYNKSNTARQTQQVARNIVEQVERDVQYGKILAGLSELDPFTGVTIEHSTGYFNSLCLLNGADLIHYRATSTASPTERRFLQRAQKTRTNETQNCDTVGFTNGDYVNLNPSNTHLRVSEGLLTIRCPDPCSETDPNFTPNSFDTVGYPLFMVNRQINSSKSTSSNLVYLLFTLASKPGNNVLDPFYDEITIITTVSSRKFAE